MPIVIVVAIAVTIYVCLCMYVFSTYCSSSYSYISDLDSFSTPQLFNTHFYTHAHRLRLEKLLYLGPSRSSNGFFKPLRDPVGDFASETAERRFQN
jgi:hypothetical protein